MNCRRITLLSLMLSLATPLWANQPAGASSQGDSKHHAAGAHAHHGHHYKHDGPIKVLKQFRKDLKLTSEQSIALEKVIKSAEEKAEKAHAQHQEKLNDKTELTAVQRMEQHIQLMEEHAREMKVCLEEFKHFYATLRPEQQKQVDQAFANKHKHHAGHRHGDRTNKRQKPEQAPAATPSAAPATAPSTDAGTTTPAGGSTPATTAPATPAAK